MNMMALRFGDDIIVIDAGMMFPESELLGIDLVIPDISYLKQNRHLVRAIVLTHGHEDHIGALPYILRDLNVPVFGTRFTLALVKKRLEEAGLLDSTTLREVIPGRRIEIHFTSAEFTAICPFSDFPDFAMLYIRYVPNRRCIELKSLKLYIVAYRNVGIFYENAVNRILEDCVAACRPKRMVVTGEFSSRGGISSVVEARYPRE